MNVFMVYKYMFHTTINVLLLQSAHGSSSRVSPELFTIASHLSRRSLTTVPASSTSYNITKSSVCYS